MRMCEVVRQSNYQRLARFNLNPRLPDLVQKQLM